jgi:Reverse transcriptase (RNA-dependent DNA polymerase)
MHKYAIGVPELAPASAADQCPTCLSAKMRKAARGLDDSRRATQCFQGISIDTGFIVQSSKNTARFRANVGLNGETNYIIISCHYIQLYAGKTQKIKAPNLAYLHRFLSAFSPNCQGKYCGMDQGGDLGGSHAVRALLQRFGYAIELTGADASHQNGPAERPHQSIGNTMRALLEGSSLPAKFWPYAFYHFLRLSNCTVHDGKDRTPIELCTGKPPDLRTLRTFGCRVYVRPPGKRPSKLDHHVRKGIFLGYAKTWKNIMYYDSATHQVKITTHARFDEGMNDLPTLPPNALYLKRAQHGDIPAEPDEISFLHLDVVDTPFAALHTELIPVTCEHPTFGLELGECSLRLRGYVTAILPHTTVSKIRDARRRYTGAYLVSVNDTPVYSSHDMLDALATCRADPNLRILKLVFAPEPYVPMADRHETPSLDLDQLRSVASIRSRIPQALLDVAGDLDGNPLDFDLLPDSTIHLMINALSNKVFGTPEEQALGSFTRRKLRPLQTWPLWRESEFKQLDAMAKQGMYGPPLAVAPPGAIVLRQHWTYSYKADTGKRKSRNCCDGSARAAPELHAVAHTYASCIEQPCMKLFFALCAGMLMLIFKTDADNAYANSPPPGRPTFVRVDNAYAEWYLARHGVLLDRSMVLPVLHALQGHPESGALWEKHINDILKALGFVSTTHERNIYQGTLDGFRILICRQVDDLAIACTDAATAQKLIKLIGQKVDLTGDSLLTTFNGIDVDQTRDYVKISCTSYIQRLLESHMWDTGFPNESTRPNIEPLPQSLLLQFDKETGPPEHSPAADALSTKHGFGYRNVLGELIYAYVTCRLDIGYAITKLAQYSGAPADIHYTALKRLCGYLRRTKHWGILYWRPQPVLSLPIGSDAPYVDTNADLPSFPCPADRFQLTGYVDAAHANDVSTRRSVTGIVFTLCGGAISYRSKLQPTVSTSSTEAEFIAAVSAAKTALYLRSVLHELGVTQHGPTILYEDNQATILMVNASRPTARSRHIAIQHFAIQEWKDHGHILLEHIPGIINPADALTKALGWILHQRHVRRAMGHYGLPSLTDF